MQPTPLQCQDLNALISQRVAAVLIAVIVIARRLRCRRRGPGCAVRCAGGGFAVDRSVCGPLQLLLPAAAAAGEPEAGVHLPHAVPGPVRLCVCGGSGGSRCLTKQHCSNIVTGQPLHWQPSFRSPSLSTAEDAAADPPAPPPIHPHNRNLPG